MSSAIERERTRLLDGHRGRHAWRLWVSGPSTLSPGKIVSVLLLASEAWILPMGLTQANVKAALTFKDLFQVF